MSESDPKFYRPAIAPLSPRGSMLRPFEEYIRAHPELIDNAFQPPVGLRGDDEVGAQRNDEESAREPSCAARIQPSLNMTMPDSSNQPDHEAQGTEVGVVRIEPDAPRGGTGAALPLPHPHQRSSSSPRNPTANGEGGEEMATPSKAKVQALIIQECRALRNLLLAKNEEYGNAALAPMRVFSRLPPIEQIKVRIDDELTRVREMMERVGEHGAPMLIVEDTVQDLLGYLVLMRVEQAIEYEEIENERRAAEDEGVDEEVPF